MAGLRQATAMTALSRGALAALLLCLAGCGALAPFETSPAGGPTAAGPGRRVAVCSASLDADEAAIRAVAMAACDGDGRPELLGRDVDIAHCPVLTASRVVFVCRKP
jgi:hypothetical protein